MNRPLAAVGSVAAAALALAGLQVAGAGAASAATTGDGVVISEVFTGAANGTAPYDADFVELYNPTSDDVDLSGLSLQLRKADDTAIGTVALSGSVAAGHHFLVQLDTNGVSAPGPRDLPTADLVADPVLTTAAVGPTAEVILGDASDYGTGDLAGNADVADAVGFGDAASYETAPAGVPGYVSTVFNSIDRADDGTDTDDNSADFTWAGPTPENTSSSAERVAPTLAADPTMFLGVYAPGHDAWPTSQGSALVVVHASGDNGTPIGTVQISGPDGYVTPQAQVAGGTAYVQFGTTGLEPGTHHLTLTYNGDATYTPATQQFDLTVEAGDTASTVSADDATLTEGNDLSEDVTVAPAAGGDTDPTGVVSLWDGNTILTSVFGTTLATGMATLSVPYAKLAPGDSTLTVKYSGDDTYAPSSSTFTVTTPAFDSTTSVTAPSVDYGTAGQVSVEVAAPDAADVSGKVTLSGAGDDQTKAIDADGKVTFDLPADLAAGDYDLTASYAGDTADRVLASTGTATFTVVGATSATTVTAPSTTYGTAGKVSVKVTATDATPSGDVTLSGAGRDQTKAVDDDGKVTFDLPASLAVGSYTLTASYAGSDAVDPSTGTATFTVVASPATTVPSVDNPQLAHDQAKLHKDKKKLKKAKKKYKKAHGAKKAKLHKKIHKLKKKVKKDKKHVKADK